MAQMKKLLLLAFILGCICPLSHGQDIHFSQFQATPLLLNPANTGFTGHFNENHYSDYRVGLNYRNQWSSFINPFVTFSGYFDKMFGKEMVKGGYLGAGLVLYSDQAGTAEFTTQTIMGSVAFHLKLGTDDEHLVSIGVQGGIMQKGINYDNLRFGNQYESIVYSPDAGHGEQFEENSLAQPIINSGINWQYSLNEDLELNAGVSLFNINQPKESYLQNPDNALNNRMMISAGATYQYNEKISILPAILFAGQAKASELVFGSQMGYNIKDIPLQKISGLFGVFYRTSDAIVLTPGIAYNNYRFGVSYDINVSSLRTASKGRGALEFSLVYVFNDNPQIGIKKSLPCKRL
jgi:type IX secretion system PorP/SprF family membrane protein